ncbi:MAG: phosphopantothenoylcysteine decarboxylase [Phycisphaeraceae bacterium]|nr:phosphopantothenoylcysteine decarboxylase [Phycisphaeraceae bacterium]
MSPSTRRTILITAGPTHEPIDAVRFIGNRSSGRLGIRLAEQAADRGWGVTLLLGPVPATPSDSRVRVRRFRTVSDLDLLLREEFPGKSGQEGPGPGVLVMAAAVADYRPVRVGGAPVDPVKTTKFRRAPGPLTIELEATPDLLAACSDRAAPGQILVGFALEPRAALQESARAKLERKRVDMIVANPLETMDAPDIEATVVRRVGQNAATPGVISKERFAVWLMDQIEAEAAARP